jgi:hypothetical protein
VQQDVPVIIPHPFVAVIGAIQPDLLASMRDEKGRADGFLDRFLFAFPDPVAAPTWRWDELSEDTLGGWRNVLESLLKLNQEPGDHGLHPEVLHLAPGAGEVWAQCFDAIVIDRNQDDFPGQLRGPWAKLQVYLARLALIVHLLRYWTRETEEKHVEAESVRRAGVLVTYFQSHARKVYAVMGADTEIEDARRLLDWIAREKRTEFKRWEIHKDIRNQSRFPRVEDLDRPLSRLSKHNYIRVRPPEDRAGAGRPPDQVYEVNPLWDRRENRVNRVNTPSGTPADPGNGHFSDLPDLPDGSESWHGGA